MRTNTAACERRSHPFECEGINQISSMRGALRPRFDERSCGIVSNYGTCESFYFKNAFLSRGDPALKNTSDVYNVGEEVNMINRGQIFSSHSMATARVIRLRRASSAICGAISTKGYSQRITHLKYALSPSFAI